MIPHEVFLEWILFEMYTFIEYVYTVPYHAFLNYVVTDVKYLINIFSLGSFINIQLIPHKVFLECIFIEMYAIDRIYI